LTFVRWIFFSLSPAWCVVGMWALTWSSHACVSDGPPQQRVHYHRALPAKTGASLQVSLRTLDLISFELPGQNISAWQITGLDEPDPIARTLSAQEMDGVLRSKQMITVSGHPDQFEKRDRPLLRNLHLGALRTGSVKLRITAPGGKPSYTASLEVTPPMGMPNLQSTPVRPLAKPGEPVPKC
jgi:hypothetical protein